MDEAARPATEHDIARMAELARQAIAELEPTRGGVVWAAREARREPIEQGLASAVSDDGARVVVGSIDDVVVGYGVVRVETMAGGGTLGVVTDIFVEPGARGVGVGEEMMRDMVEWCSQRACIGIDAMALPGHRAAKNFFEEFGFTARQIVMHRSLVR